MKFKTMQDVEISPDEYDFDWGDMSLEGEDFVLPETQAKYDSELSAKELQLMSKDEQITALKKQVTALEEDNLSLRKRLLTVVKMVMPLLNNLSREPDKPTIYWPERAIKVQEFKDKLLGVSGVEI